ncbi:MAG: cobalt ECF transporter T component CbiQ [Gordonia amarae]
MGAGHAHPLYRQGDSRVHRAPAEAKLVCLVGFVFAVVATPRELFWPYLVFAAILVTVWVIARIPLRWIAPRMLIEAPFVVLAVLLPFAEGGERTEVLGLSLSVSGLYAAWGILIKGTLGVAASLTFAATTRADELPIALSRLGLPGMITQILVMMLRYIDLLSVQVGRQRIARMARGDDPRFAHQAAAIAKGVGSLFMRSYERGERVHLAMASRGFTGRIPEIPALVTSAKATGAQWLMVTAPALTAVAVSLIAWELW